MTTNAANDACIWTIAGALTCGVHGCTQDAAIIDNTNQHHRFCADHTLEAATVALNFPSFSGWYRITDTTRRAHQLILEVHPL